MMKSIFHNSHIRANCNGLSVNQVGSTADSQFTYTCELQRCCCIADYLHQNFTIHIYARIATATYCVSNFNSRICSNSISNIYFVLPILRHILPISYTSLVRISQCFYEYLYFAQGGLCLRPLY